MGAENSVPRHDVPVLNHATTEQKRAFEVAFTRLPSSVKSVILENGFSFSVAEKMGYAPGNNKEIHLSAQMFPAPGASPARGLSGKILGYSLASLYSSYQPENDSLLKSAMKEDAERVLQETGILGALLIDRPFNDRLGELLTGTYVDINAPNRGPEVDALLEARRQVYDRFLHLAETRAKPLHVGTQQPGVSPDAVENVSAPAVYLKEHSEGGASKKNEFQLRGPRIASHQALVLIPALGLVPIANAMLLQNEEFGNIRNAIAIFEPEHCRDEASFRKRLKEEWERFNASHIEIRYSKDPTKIFDTDKHFQTFSDGAIQLYAIASEYVARLNNQPIPFDKVDHDKLGENILQNGCLHPIWVGKVHDGHASVLLGHILKRSIDTNGVRPVWSKSPYPPIFQSQPVASVGQIRSFEHAYGQWPENFRTVAESAGIIYLFDAESMGNYHISNKQFAKPSTGFRVVVLNAKGGGKLNQLQIDHVKDQVRSLAMFNHGVDMQAVWADSLNECVRQANSKELKKWLRYDGADKYGNQDTSLTICNLRRQNPAEYRRLLPQTFAADQRCDELVEEMAQKILRPKQVVPKQSGPRIVNDPTYGEKISPQDVALFLEGYEQWDDWIKQFITDSNITFVIGRDQPTAGRAPYDPIKKTIEIDIAETNSVPFRKSHQAPAMFMSLLCVMDGKMPKGLAWEAAEYELIQESHRQKSPVTQVSRASILASTHRAIGGWNYKDAWANNCPNALNVYNTFMDAARKEAAKVAENKAGENVAAMEATDTAFVINTDEKTGLTKPQQAYFESLNEIISILGVSPKEFDDQFRVMAASTLFAHGETFSKYAITAYSSAIRSSKKSKEFVSKISNAAENWDSSKFEFYRSLTPIFSGDPEAKADRKKRLRDLGLLNKAATREWAAFYEPHLGISKISSPPLARQWEIDFINYSINKRQQVKEPSDEMKNKLSERTLQALRKIQSEPGYLEIEHPSIVETTNLLQLYANGIKSVNMLSKQRHSENREGISITLPSAADYMNNAIINAVHILTQKKNISGAQLERLTKLMEEMDQSWPQVVMTKAEYQRFEAQEAEREHRRQKTLERERIAKEKEEVARLERERKAEEEARKPKPYKLDLSSDAAIAQEIHALCGLLDCRMPSHQTLGDTLFPTELMGVVHQHIAGQMGQVRASLDATKNPEVDASLQRACEAVENIFKLKPEQISDEQRETIEKIKEVLLQSPMFLALILGNQELIDAAQICHNEAEELGEDRAAYLQDHVKGMLSTNWKALAKLIFPEAVDQIAVSFTPPNTAENQPVASDSSALPPVMLSPLEKEASAAGKSATASVAPIAAAAAGASALVASVAMSGETMLASNVTAEPPTAPLKALPVVGSVGASADVSTPSTTTETVTMPLETVLQDDPALSTAELNRRRAQAYQSMARQLADDASIAGIRALEDGYDQFRCDLLLNKTHARIRLLFKCADGSKPNREEFFELNSNSYIGGYARLGVVPTTLDAINLRIIVNGEIAADGDFLPILSETSPGKARIGKNDFIPNRAIHGDYKHRIIVNSAGLYQLELTSRFTKNGDDVTITFPLGAKEDRKDKSKAEEAKAIAEARGKIVTDYIDHYNDNAAKRRKVPIKGEIQEHLETEVRNIRNVNAEDPAGQWAYPDRIQLLVSDGRLKHQYLKQTDPVYEESYKRTKDDADSKKARQAARDAIPSIVVYDDEWQKSLAKAGEDQYREIKIPIDTLDKHPLKEQRQVTTLGAVALSKKGSNRTYHLEFNLHVNDGTAKAKTREDAAGYHIRGRSLDLCIEDPEIARSRAQEALFGNKNVPGFINMLIQYFNQHPQARWALETAKNDSEEVKKCLSANLDTETKNILDTEAVKAYRQMVKDELPITSTTRRLNVLREKPEHGMVTIRVQIEEKQGNGYAVAKGADNKDLALFFSVPEKSADLVEQFVRGDMDGARLNVLINDLIPRFEHDLSVKVDKGEVKEGKIPVNFSVMRGKRDGRLEQHLDRHGKPVNMRLLAPERHEAFICSQDPGKDALAETVDKHVSLLSAIHYSPIAPAKPFDDNLGYGDLKRQYTQARNDRDGFIDQTHPDFNPDLPRRWLEHAVTSNMRYHLPDIADVQVLREARNGNGGSSHGKPHGGARERFPGGTFTYWGDGGAHAHGSFVGRVGKESYVGFEQGI